MKGLKKNKQKTPKNPKTKQDKPGEFSGKTRSLFHFHAGSEILCTKLHTSANPTPSEIMGTLQYRALKKKNQNKQNFYGFFIDSENSKFHRTGDTCEPL